MRTDFLVLLDLLKHDFNALTLVHILVLVNFGDELIGVAEKFGNFLGNLAFDLNFSLVSLLSSFAKLMRELGLQLVCGGDLSLTTLLLFAYDFSVHAQLEDAAVQLDRVLDSLEVLVNAFHALDLAHIGSHALRILTDRIDLLL